MIQTHASLLLHRALLAGISRLFAISNVLSGLGYVVQYLVQVLLSMLRAPTFAGSSFDFEYWLDVALYVLPAFAAAALFWFKADAIADFVLRFRPTSACAGCGYPMGDAPAGDSRCPECGLPLRDAEVKPAERFPKDADA